MCRLSSRFSKAIPGPEKGGRVTFWARSRDPGSGNPSEPYTVTGVEFIRRWALHILRKGFVKSLFFATPAGTPTQGP